MKMVRDYQKVCYVIEIPQKEMTEITRKAYEMAGEGNKHFDFCLARILADRMVPMINKDLSAYGR